MNEDDPINDFEVLPAAPEKRRAGVYLDIELFELVSRIAHRNGLSWNDCAVKLIQRGISTIRKKKGARADGRQ